MKQKQKLKRPITILRQNFNIIYLKKGFRKIKTKLPDYYNKAIWCIWNNNTQRYEYDGIKSIDDIKEYLLNSYNGLYKYEGGVYKEHNDCSNIKKFKRFIKKHNSNLPIGTKLILVSNYLIQSKKGKEYSLDVEWIKKV